MHTEAGDKLAFASERTCPHIIWVAAYPPCPPLNGTTLKSAGLIRGLAEFLPLTVVVNHVHSDGPDAITRCRTYWKGVRGVRLEFVYSWKRAAGLRWLLRLMFKREAAFELEKIATRVESLRAVLGETIVVLDDAMLSRLVRVVRHPVVLSPHDCLSQLFRIEAAQASSWSTKFAFIYRYIVVSRYESALYRLADAVHVVADRDAKLLRQIDPTINAFVCPNAGHLPLTDKMAAERDIDILIWGNFGSAPLRRGLDQLFSALQRDDHCWSSRRVVVLGPGGESVCTQGALARRFTFIERVQNLPEFLSRVKVCLLPDTEGMGIKNRAIDAMSRAVCIVSVPSQLESLPLWQQFAHPVDRISDAPETVDMLLRTGEYAQRGALAAAIFGECLSFRAVGGTFLKQLKAIGCFTSDKK